MTKHVSLYSIYLASHSCQNVFYACIYMFIGRIAFNISWIQGVINIYFAVCGVVNDVIAGHLRYLLSFPCNHLMNKRKPYPDHPVRINGIFLHKLYIVHCIY